MKYCATAGALVEYPPAIAIADTVSEEVIAIGPVYFVADSVGTVPLVV